MLFGPIRSSSSQSKSSSTCNIFAVACDLKSQLQTIEERFTRGQELAEELKHKRNELQEILRLFELIEVNERTVRQELERELERALEDLPYEHAAAIRLDPEASVSTIMERLAQETHAETPLDAADKENVFVPNRERSKSANSKSDSIRSLPRVTLPPRWKKVIAMYVAAAVKDRAAAAKATTTTSASTSAPVTASPLFTSADPSLSHTADQSSPSIETTSLVSTAALCGGGSRSKVAQVIKSTKKPRRVSGSGSWSSKPYKARKQFKAPRLSKFCKSSNPPLKTAGLGDRPRHTGLGVFGGQWNSNAGGNKENVDPFGYTMNI